MPPDDDFALTDPAVAAAFERFDPDLRRPLLHLRRLILDRGREVLGPGGVVEAVKWGEPAYLPAIPRQGTTLRLGSPGVGRVAVYAHCQTSVIADFRQIFGPDFAYDGNRAVILPVDRPLPIAPLRQLVDDAFRYHARRRVNPDRRAAG